MAKLIKDMTKREYCHDCGISIGFEHIDGCDNETCTDCGLQKISCGCEDVNSREKWSGIGQLRMLQICEEQNLYTKWDGGWVPAEKDDPKSTHDLNRAAAVLMREKNNV